MGEKKRFDIHTLSFYLVGTVDFVRTGERTIRDAREKALMPTLTEIHVEGTQRASEEREREISFLLQCGGPPHR